MRWWCASCNCLSKHSCCIVFISYIFILSHPSKSERERLSLSAFWGTEDIGVHIPPSDAAWRIPCKCTFTIILEESDLLISTLHLFTPCNPLVYHTIDSGDLLTGLSIGLSDYLWPNSEIHMNYIPVILICLWIITRDPYNQCEFILISPWMSNYIC